MSSWPRGWFDPDCTRCRRLARHLRDVREARPGYYARPVPPVGPADASLVIVGLAPGMHGANRTGRPFTGDYAGLLLYRTLHELGLSNTAESVSADDGLRLFGVRITNAVKCLPPANRPTGDEVRQCNRYLAAELADSGPSAILALGRIAHDAVLKAFGLRLKDWPFGHGAVHRPRGRPVVVDSYHCSRYNTQTGRLTDAMFREAVKTAAGYAGLTNER
ncbi:MAG: uracil-DNA glycosylase [Gammaproteobacteria bacterium]